MLARCWDAPGLQRWLRRPRARLVCGPGSGEPHFAAIFQLFGAGEPTLVVARHAGEAEQRRAVNERARADQIRRCARALPSAGARILHGALLRERARDFLAELARDVVAG